MKLDPTQPNIGFTRKQPKHTTKRKLLLYGISTIYGRRFKRLRPLTRLLCSKKQKSLPRSGEKKCNTMPIAPLKLNQSCRQSASNTSET